MDTRLVSKEMNIETTVENKTNDNKKKMGKGQKTYSRIQLER